MDRVKTWAFRLGCAAVTAGALLSRDACLGGPHPPPPDPKTSPPAATATAAPATASPAATPAPTATYATPP